MLWSKNSDAVEEIQLDVELQHPQHESGTVTQVPVDRRMRRGLKSRHIQLIALGGSIGTGLFVGTGTTLAVAGPAPLFMCTSPVSRLPSPIYLIWPKVQRSNVYVQPSLSYQLSFGLWFKALQR